MCNNFLRIHFLVTIFFGFCNFYVQAGGEPKAEEEESWAKRQKNNPAELLAPPVFSVSLEQPFLTQNLLPFLDIEDQIVLSQTSREWLQHVYAYFLETKAPLESLTIKPSPRGSSLLFQLKEPRTLLLYHPSTPDDKESVKSWIPQLKAVKTKLLQLEQVTLEEQSLSEITLIFLSHLPHRKKARLFKCHFQEKWLKHFIYDVSRNDERTPQLIIQNCTVVKDKA